MNKPQVAANKKVTSTSSNPLWDALADVTVDPVEEKSDQVANDLAAMLAYKCVSRADLAKRLGCTRSRVTSIFSGKNNLTLKTIYEVSNHLGYDFDVVFREFEKPRASQPWHHQYVVVFEVPNRPLVNVTAQTGDEVVGDYFQGNAKKVYYSFNEVATFDAPLVQYLSDNQSIHQIVNMRFNPDINLSPEDYCHDDKAIKKSK